MKVKATTYKPLFAERYFDKTAAERRADTLRNKYTVVQVVDGIYKYGPFGLFSKPSYLTTVYVRAE